MRVAQTQGLEPVVEHVWLYRDAVNVYAVQFESGNVALVDLGSGGVLEAASRAGLPRPQMVLHTDFRRDRTHGHHAHPGLPVAAGEEDQRYFEQAERIWRELDVYHGYGAYPRFWMPRQNIPIHIALTDGHLPLWERPYLYAQKTPAHTPGGMSYLMVHDGRRYVFCGDLLQADGTLHSIYELQYTYNFMEGLHGVRRAASWILASEFDGVFPAHGEPILGRNAVREAARRLLDRIESFWERWRLIWPDQPPGGINDFDPATPHLRAATNRIAYALTDDEGHALFFDTGVNYEDGFQEVLAQKGIRDVELTLITHHHDDHVMGYDWLQATYGTKLGCHECMVDVLQNPAAYALNCLHHEPLPVDVVLKEGEPFEWRGYTILPYWFPSQTTYHAAYFVEVDGRRVLVSGDALYWEPGLTVIRPTNPDWRNRFDVDSGYHVCADVLERVRPDLLAAAHVHPWDIPPDGPRAFRENAAAFHRSLRELVGRKHPTMGIDPFWVSIYPYRLKLAPGQPTAVEVRVDNPLDETATIELRPRLPEGIRAAPVEQTAELAPKQHGGLHFELTLLDGEALRDRAVWTLDVRFNGERLGEAFEGMLEVST